MDAKSKFIYVGNEKVYVSDEVYRAYYQTIWRIFKKEKRYGRCTATFWWDCEGDCSICSYHCESEFIPIDEVDDSNLRETIEDVANEVISRMFVEEVCQLAEKIDPDGRLILYLIIEDAKEEDVAKLFSITQSAYNKRKNKLKKKLRDELKAIR